MRHTRALLIAWLISFSACDNDTDPNWRVRSYEIGRTEAELRRDVGPPTRERSLDLSNAQELCNGTLAVRELIYEIPSRGIDKKARDLLGIPASVWIVVCVNADSRIVKVWHVDVG